MNENENIKVGTISLWASILGIVVPILIAFLVRLFVKSNDELYYILCVFLFAGAELIALVTGIIGRKTATGKAGMCIALACVLMPALSIPMFTARQVDAEPGLQKPAKP